MINIKSKTCIHPGCNTRPNYNKKGEKNALYCASHKLENMINVKDKTCIYLGCNIHASYGKLFMPKNHCATHKSSNEYLKNNPKCEFSNCKNKPFFTNDKTNYPKRCELHKLNDDINIIEKPCSSCNLPNFINNDLSLCNDCFDYNIKKVHKAKEQHIKDVLNANDMNYISHDKIPEFGCYKKRPDFIFDFIIFYVILEVDENQHKSYACECEQARMVMLHQEFGGAPLLFIRYNPDDYIDHLGNKIKGNNKHRESKLIEMLKCLKNRKEWNEPISVYYLYYDGYDEKNNELHRLEYFQNEIQLIDN